MADLEVSNPEFEITVNIDGEEKQITVKPDETSDGVEFYKCTIASESFTQIRQGDEGEWEQLWGDLDQQTVDAIGSVILENK